MSALVAQAEDEDPLRALAAVAQLHREVDRAEAIVVRRARVGGATWEQIARVLGVSRQAVHKKYGGTRFSRG
jgi:DNA-directed RNA polymerase specialized sigma24 family protein